MNFFEQDDMRTVLHHGHISLELWSPVINFGQVSIGPEHAYKLMFPQMHACADIQCACTYAQSITQNNL
jgi:hypothetical protein